MVKKATAEIIEIRPIQIKTFTVHIVGDAPLHNEFEWNDSVAAEAYRETQARHIINCIEIVREEKEPVRAFFSISRAEPEYRHIDAIMKEEDKRQALLNMALAELLSFKKKYAQLEELAAVFTAIDEVA